MPRPRGDVPILSEPVLSQVLRQRLAESRAGAYTDSSSRYSVRAMLNFLRRRLDELVTCAFLLLVFVLKIARPPIFATAGGLLLARIVFTSSGVVLAVLVLARPLSRFARTLLGVVLKIGPVLVAVLGYTSLRLLHAESVTAWLGFVSKDHSMMAADVALFGKTPYLWIGEWGLDGHLFQRVMASLYAFYPFTPVIALAWFLWKHDEAQFWLIRRTLLISLYCGYCCYLLIPVSGPLSLMGNSPFYIQSTSTYKFLMNNFRYPYDCFPSLHTANPWLLWWLCRRKLPRSAVGIGALICSGITFSTMALRLHYGVDVLAGFGWACLMLFAGRATLPREGHIQITHQPIVEAAT